MKRVEINKETKKTNFKLKLKDESQKIREANFIQELEQDIKRVETEKKIKKYNYQTEKHASSLEEQKEMKTRGKSNPDKSWTIFWSQTVRVDLDNLVSKLEIEQKERAVIERKRKLESDRQSWVTELDRRRNQRLQEITKKHETEKQNILKGN